MLEGGQKDTNGAQKITWLPQKQKTNSGEQILLQRGIFETEFTI